MKRVLTSLIVAIPLIFVLWQLMVPPQTASLAVGEKTTITVSGKEISVELAEIAVDTDLLGWWLTLVVNKTRMEPVWVDMTLPYGKVNGLPFEVKDSGETIEISYR